MRVGVTGASGFIGRALIAAFEERGDTVVRFLRPTTNGVSGLVVRWDPERGVVDEGDLRLAGGFDAVVHLAGTGIGDHRWTPARKAAILGSRLDSTSLLVRALSDLPSGAAVVVSASAIGWYGDRGDEILDETSQRGVGFLSDVCFSWEDAIRPLASRGSTVAHIRSGIVMSAVGGALKKQLPLFRLGLGGRFGSGHQWLSPIALVDEIRAILWTIDHSISGPVNLVAPEPVTNRVFTDSLARRLHRPAVLSIPRRPLELALGREMADELVLASQRVLPRELASTGFEFLCPDLSTILQRALGVT